MDALIENETRRKLWEYRKRHGCAGCELIEKDENGFICKHSGSRIEKRFCETYNVETKKMEVFSTIGEPNSKCRDYFQERKEFGR